MTESLASAIERAFGDCAYPDGDPISMAAADEGTREHFANTHWRDHSAQELQYHTFALHVLTPHAFRYFLPAFLLASLNDAMPGLRDSLVMKLCPPKNDPKRPSYYSWWQLLTPQQRHVVLQFLRQVAPENPNHFEPVIASLEANIAV